MKNVYSPVVDLVGNVCHFGVVHRDDRIVLDFHDQDLDIPLL